MAAEGLTAVPSAPRRATTSSNGHGSTQPGLGMYDVGDFYDEMFDGDGQPRRHCRPLYDRLWRLDGAELRRRQHAAERSMRRLGITFSVYGDQEGSERIIPFDICPRIVLESEWRWVERG